MNSLNLMSQINGLDPVLHKALFERLAGNYQRLPGNALENSSPSPNKGEEELLPFIDKRGDLSIPFESNRRFHWWNGGQSIEETIREIEIRFQGPKGKING